MEPFVTPATESAGRSALGSLFTPPAAPAPTSKSSAKPQAAGNPPPESAAPSHEEAPTYEPGEQGSLGDLPPDAASAPTDPNQEAAADPAGADANFFEFSVTDDKGRRKVKVDLNDRDKLARILPQAYGFRKMQTERDAANAWRKDAEPRLQELETQWQTLERTYQDGGLEGLVDLLGGKQGHYKEWLAQEVTKDTRYKSATQAERERMDLEARVVKMQRDSELREKRAADEAKKASSEREQADLTNLEAQLVPAFNKYRFAGTLGNESQERAFDKAIWDQAIQNLEQLPDSTPLNAALIEKEFRSVAMAFKAAIGKQASAKTREVIEKTKQAAQTQVAAAATQAMSRPGTLEQRMAANVRRGGLGGLTAGLMDVLRSR